MGKKRKADSDDEEDAKKKKKRDKKEKKKVKKKRDKSKKKKEKKKGKKQESSSSESSSGSSDGEPDAKKRKGDGEALVAAPPCVVELPPPEEGILRFEFSIEEGGPLGLRFSGGFPPLILAVNPDSSSSKKGIPPNHEVHAINGLELVPEHRDKVMSGLKSRPLTLDVRPQGWKPSAKVKELRQRKEREEAERQAAILAETERREQVAKEAKEQEEREAAEKAERKERERLEQEELVRKAREARAAQKAKEEEFYKALAADPEDIRKSASDLMEAEYGSSAKLPGGRKGLPLRLFTRRREVAWLWAGEAAELIGGGVPDEGSWSAA